MLSLSAPLAIVPSAPSTSAIVSVPWLGPVAVSVDVSLPVSWPVLVSAPPLLSVVSLRFAVKLSVSVELSVSVVVVVSVPLTLRLVPAASESVSVRLPPMIAPPAPRVSVIDSEKVEPSADGSEELNVSLSVSLVLSVEESPVSSSTALSVAVSLSWPLTVVPELAVSLLVSMFRSLPPVISPARPSVWLDSSSSVSVLVVGPGQRAGLGGVSRVVVAERRAGDAAPVGFRLRCPCPRPRRSSVSPSVAASVSEVEPEPLSTIPAAP